jgi:CHAD domain-containing protein
MAKAREIPGLDGTMTFGEAAARTVAVRAQEVFDHADGVLDMGDIERVHAMRVATRRLRAVLEIYEPCFPRKALRPVLSEVKDLADALGERRDPDVELLALEQFAASVGPDERAGVQTFIDRTRAEQADGNARLAAALREAERTGLRARLEELAALAQPSVPAVPAPEPAEPEPPTADAVPDPADEPEPRFHPADLGEHPHGLGIADGPAPATVNTDTGW